MSVILVTGGGGFLGTNLCLELLRRGEGDIIVLDNFSTGDRDNIKGLGVEIIRHDVRDPFTVECDLIYHLACPASPPAYQVDPSGTVLTAVQGTFNALKCAGRVGARILIASTSEVYGEPLHHPQAEGNFSHFNSVGPRSCYDCGKAAAESLAVDASDNDVEVRIARIFNTYGTFMDPEDGRVISNFICQALRGEPLTVYGDGLQTRSFCYVDDLVNGLIKLMENDLGEGLPVNIGNPNEQTMLDVAKLVLELTGSKSEIVHEDLPKNDPTRRLPDIGFMTRMTGWKPEVSFNDGLKKTIKYFAGVIKCK